MLSNLNRDKYTLRASQSQVIGYSIFVSIDKSEIQSALVSQTVDKFDFEIVLTN